MEFKYRCPYCKSILNPSNKLIFRINKEDQKSLILISPEPGDYTFFVDPKIKFTKGDQWDFFCPVCSEDLKSLEEDGMGMLLVTSILVGKTEGKTRPLLFSRIVGVHATFILDDNQLKSFGPDSLNYEAMIKNKYL